MVDPSCQKGRLGGVERTKSDEGVSTFEDINIVCLPFSDGLFFSVQVPSSLIGLSRKKEAPARSVPTLTFDQKFEPTRTSSRSVCSWDKSCSPSTDSDSSFDVQTSREVCVHSPIAALFTDHVLTLSIYLSKYCSR